MTPTRSSPRTPGAASEAPDRTRTVVVDGLYGIQSYGDDAMLLALTGKLREQVPGVTFRVLSRHPEMLAERYGIDALQNLDHPAGVERGYWFYGFNPGQPREHIDRIRDTIAASDLLVIGGGNLLLDVTHDWLRGPIAWHAFSSEMARVHGVPYALFSNSVGPFRTAWGRTRSAHVVRGAASVTVRDVASEELVAEMRGGRDGLARAPDPALLLEPDGVGAAEILDRECSDLGRDQTLVGISVRDLAWKTGPDAMQGYLASVAEVCDRLVEEQGRRLLFVPQCAYEHGGPEEDDRRVSLHVLERMRHPDRATVVRGQYRADAILGLYERLDLALVTRLHGAVFAAVCRTPFLAIRYLPKVTGFLEEIGMAELGLGLEELGDAARVAARLLALGGDEAVAGRLDRGVRKATRAAAVHIDALARLL